MRHPLVQPAPPPASLEPADPADGHGHRNRLADPRDRRDRDQRGTRAACWSRISTTGWRTPPSRRDARCRCPQFPGAHARGVRRARRGPPGAGLPLHPPVGRRHRLRRLHRRATARSSALTDAQITEVGDAIGQGGFTTVSLGDGIGDYRICRVQGETFVGDRGPARLRGAQHHRRDPHHDRPGHRRRPAAARRRDRVRDPRRPQAPARGRRHRDPRRRRSRSPRARSRSPSACRTTRPTSTPRSGASATR